MFFKTTMGLFVWSRIQRNYIIGEMAYLSAASLCFHNMMVLSMWISLAVMVLNMWIALVVMIENQVASWIFWWKKKKKQSHAFFGSVMTNFNYLWSKLYMDMTSSSSSIVHYQDVDENMTLKLGMHFESLENQAGWPLRMGRTVAGRAHSLGPAWPMAQVVPGGPLNRNGPARPIWHLYVGINIMGPT